MTDEIKKMYIKHFRHFSERLSLRYGILISFEQYIELHVQIIEVTEIKIDENGRKTTIGYISVNDQKIKVVKSLWVLGKPLTTALPLSKFTKLLP